MFCTTLEQFGSFEYAMMTSFTGLLGDMDVKGMTEMKPTWGPILYIAYITIIFFVGFTILVAIISRSYENIKENPNPNKGLITDAYAFFMSLQGNPATPEESKHVDDDDDEAKQPSKEKKSIQDVLEAIQHRLDSMEEIIKQQQPTAIGERNQTMKSPRTNPPQRFETARMDTPPQSSEISEMRSSFKDRADKRQTARQARPAPTSGESAIVL